MEVNGDIAANFTHFFFFFKVTTRGLGSFYDFFFFSFHQGSRQSPLLAKMGGDLGSPSFPPVKAVARARLPASAGRRGAFSPRLGSACFYAQKIFQHC